MKQSKQAYIFLFLAFLLYSLSVFFSKLSSTRAGTDFIVYYGISLLFLAGYALLWQLALKNISLSTAYPLKAITIVIGLILGVLFFQETVNWKMLVGIVFILAGVFLVGGKNE